LGVVLYEMLTGTLPYGGEDPTSIAFQHVHGPLRSPREANPDIPEPLNALTTKLLAKYPEDRHSSAAELADDLERVRSGLSPLNVTVETTTTEMVTAPLLSRRDQRGQKTALPPRVAAPIMEVFKSGGRVRGRLLRTLAMALCGVLLLGGLAWALTKDQSTPETSGSEVVSSTEEAVAPSAVQEVPELYNVSEVESALADAGLELGDRNEVSDAAILAGVVIAQDPEAGTTVEEGTAVDILVSTGPEQAPAALQAAPVGVDAGSQQPAPAAQPAASKAAGTKHVPAAVQEAPVSVTDGSSQEAPAAQSATPSAMGQRQASGVRAAPTGVDTGLRQEAPTSWAASAAIQTASSSSVSDTTE
jgi:serine/threonine-protein kinase